LLGIDSIYTIEHIFLFLLINIMIYFSWKVSVHLWNKQMGSITLLLSATFIPYFMYILYFYTDTVIICFVPIILYFYMKYKQKQSLGIFIIIGIFIGIGYQIRPNIIIMLPAIIIYMFFTLP